MKVSILTLFPEMFSGPFDYSILKRAQEKGLVTIEFVHIRDFGIGKHKLVDDTPYGGGVGMILRVDVIEKALNSLRCKEKCDERVILTDAAGSMFSQRKAQELTTSDHLIIICGRYEGFDARVDDLVDEKISIGPYVLSGGELPAMVILDSVIRLLPGVLTKEGATEIESHTEEGVLEFPQYTKPVEWNGKKVSEVLLSGNHKKIKEWREKNTKKLSGLKKLQAE